MNNIDNESNEMEEKEDDEDIICWTLLKEQTTRSLEENIDLDFLLNLRKGHSLPQNVMQVITFGLKSLIELVHKLLKTRMGNSSSEYQTTSTASSTNGFLS